MHVLEVALRLADHLIEVVDGVSFDQCFRHHHVHCLARLVKINLSKEFEASLENYIDVILDLLVVCNFVVYDAGVAENARVLDSAFVNLSVSEVSVQVIQLVQIEGIALVGHNVE
jgi:hypothetical protein